MRRLRKIPWGFAALVLASALLCWRGTVRAIPPAFLAKSSNGAAQFNPNQLTNLILWWNGDYQMANNGGTNNAPVSKYYDKTIHLNHGYTNVEDPTHIPLVISNAVNGHALVRFTKTNFYSVTTNFFTNFQQGELWAVLKTAPDSDSVIWTFCQNGAVQGDAAYPNKSFSKGQTNCFQENFGSWITYDGLVPLENYVGLNLTNSGYHIYSIFTMTNQMIFAIDGEMIAGGSRVVQGMITNPVVGKGLSAESRWSGDLVDLYIFDYFNSELNRSNMLGYLTNLYAIPAITNTFALSATDTNRWNPTNYLASMHTWICATNFNGQTNNAPIGTNGNFWTDQSGHGNHWTNVTLAQMPKFCSNIFGTLPAVHFDSADDRLFCITNLNLANTNDVTIWAVMQHTNNGAQAPLWSKTGSAIYARMNSAGLNTMGWASSGTVQPDNGQFQNTNTTTQVAVFQRTNGVWTIWRNLEPALLYTGGAGSRTNVNAITFDTWGFHSDFGVGSDCYLYEFAVITNRFLPQWDIVNLYRFYHKPNNSALP